MSRNESGGAAPLNPDRPRLRIAVFNRTFSSTGGGAERYSMALVEQLAARHEIHVFAQQINHHWPGVFYHRVSAPLPKPRWINQLWFATATWWATRRGYDVVHSHENTWHGNVQTVHVLPVKYNLFQGRTGWRRLLRYIKVATSPRLLTYLGLERLRFSLNLQRCIVATSPALKEILMHTYPDCSDGLAVIPPGVSLPDVCINRAEARNSLGLPTKGRLIAFVANNYKKKGLGTLLEALRDLPSDVAVAVVGDPSYIDHFKQKAESLGVGNRVHFLGYLEDVSLLYCAADILAHPTFEDTFAMVVLEAMSYGLAVVVSEARYCGIAGLLTDGVNARILHSPNDSTELSAHLRQILQAPALYEALTMGARFFAARWSWATIAEQQDRMYREIAARSVRIANRDAP
jgi:glycosyltransferase involved in cell wall biosynthesis